MSPRSTPAIHASGLGEHGPRFRLLDHAIMVAAARAAAPGGIRFTERQLYYETCRVLRPALPGLPRISRGTAPPLRLPRFTRALHALAPSLPGLLPETTITQPGRNSPSSEPDLYDYGLPRALICQDRSIARMLLANQMHLEAACPILSVQDDLPPHPRLVAALAETDGGTVYVLHDASPAGVVLPGQVRATLGPHVRVSSLGLVPRHVAALHLVSGRTPTPTPLPRPLPKGLRPKEVAWLAEGRFAQLAAVHPARLLRTVLRLTRGPRTPRSSMWTDLRHLRARGFLTWPTH